ncbi:DEAD/DEAH box helicase, partial [Salmonella enterica subsp. enterica serovar Cerro]|nr:DEAD/DEAH box helicase [Salmonella enterica subsp. enterica serovar Cerro]
PVQAAALPVILAGNDVRVQARTGSGKTAAFGLGLLHRIDVTLAIIKPVVNNTGNVARLWINGIFCVLSICTTSVCESSPSINQP